MPIGSFYTPVVANPSQGELITLCRILDTLSTNSSAEQPTVVGSISTGSGSLVVTASDVATLAFSTTAATSGTITIYGSVDGALYLQTTYVALTSGGSASSFNAATATIGQINTVGLAYIKFVASSLVGSISITTVGAIAVSNVMIDNSLPAGSNVIGGVTTQTSNTQLVPTVAGGAYTAGYCVGGLLTFTSALGVLGSGVIQDVSIVAKSSVQTSALNLYLFNASPSSTFTDKTAVTWSASDSTKLIGVVPVASTNTIIGATMTLWYQDAIAKAVALGAGITTLYGALVLQTSTTTNIVANEITINLTILKDG